MLVTELQPVPTVFESLEIDRYNLEFGEAPQVILMQLNFKCH